MIKSFQERLDNHRATVLSGLCIGSLNFFRRFEIDRDATTVIIETRIMRRNGAF